MSTTSVRRTNPTGYATLSATCSEWGPARRTADRADPRAGNDGAGTALRDGDDARPDDN
ncbi:MAG: hypothetical protein L0H31_07005 [Nocardioidaceae bacterium]|nr:hypothetical protein [Nocardioidaceae bacterium]